MPLIFETDKFLVIGHDSPHHDRDNGGHAVVSPKTKYASREDMPTQEYLGLMGLVKISGEAILHVMRTKGVEVVRINYQDNGNWSYFPQTQKDPHIHVHMYVRSRKEKHPSEDMRFRAFPEALNFPYTKDTPEYYENFKPYTRQDCDDFAKEIDRLLLLEDNQEIKDLMI